MFPSIACVLSLAFLLQGVVAPIPPCSPLTFVNKIVESDQLAWLLRDLPGHPVRPCPYSDPSAASLDERSVAHFFLSDPNRIVKELQLEGDFWSQRGFARANERIWSLYEDRPYRPGQYDSGFGPGGSLPYPQYSVEGVALPSNGQIPNPDLFDDISLTGIRPGPVIETF